MVDLVTARMLVRPLTHRIEHVTLNLNTLVSESWVVESMQDVTHNLVNGNAGIIPGIEDASVKDVRCQQYEIENSLK